MRYALAAAAIAGVATASWGGDSWSHGGQGSGSWGPPTNGTGEVYVTEVVTAFTTFCPEATVITHGSTTYSATASQTLTITGPVTITKPISTSVVTVCTTCAPVTSVPAPPATSAPAPPVTTSKSTPVGPIGTGSSSKPAAGTGSLTKKPVPSGTAPAGTAPAGTGSKVVPSGTSSPIATYTGAATQLQAGVAGALAVFGLIAAL